MFLATQNDPDGGARLLFYLDHFFGLAAQRRLSICISRPASRRTGCCCIADAFGGAQCISTRPKDSARCLTRAIASNLRLSLTATWPVPSAMQATMLPPEAEPQVAAPSRLLEMVELNSKTSVWPKRIDGNDDAREASIRRLVTGCRTHAGISARMHSHGNDNVHGAVSVPPSPLSNPFSPTRLQL